MKKNPVKEILKRAAKLVDKGWCRGNNAKDREGMGVTCLSTAAVKFCLVGAVWRSTKDLMLDPLQEMEACDALREVLDYSELTTWNDKPGRRKYQVVAALKKAAAESA